MRLDASLFARMRRLRIDINPRCDARSEYDTIAPTSVDFDMPSA
jgi:hypothetical protein